MAMRDYLAGEVAEDYADGLLTRREAMRRLGLLGLGLTSAATLLAACGGDDDDDNAANTTAPPSTAGNTTTTGAAPGTESTISFEGPNGTLFAAYAAAEEPKGAVLLIHENRGLTPHFHDLAGRFAH